jgi:disulfide bond formation protein DsbB
VLPSPRLRWLLIAAAALACLASALVLQHAFEKEPCPLCILQRYAYVGVGLFALLAAWRSPATDHWVWGGQAAASGLAGLGVAIHHVNLLANPEGASCSFAIARLVEELPTAQWLPSVFSATGLCTDIGFSLMGLSMPQWSAVSLAALSLAALVGLWADARAARRAAG